MTDTDVNDDGLVDVIVPTRPCALATKTPPTVHGPHANFEAPPNTTRCPGYEETP
jgi:hypothetical protein